MIKTMPDKIATARVTARQAALFAGVRLLNGCMIWTGI
jgi:hypothetical protein